MWSRARAASAAPRCSSSAPPKRRSRRRPAGRTPERVGLHAARAGSRIPSGLGEQAPLIAEGIDAVAISSAGERPLAAADDQLDDLAPESIDAFGRAIQSAIGALDVAVAEPVHGPSAHIEIGRNLVPGWALAALALALILPAAVAAVDACARAMRARLGIGAGARLGGGAAACRSSARWRSSTAWSRSGSCPNPDVSLRPQPLRDRGPRPRSPSALVAARRRGHASPPCASGATPPPRRLRRPAARPSARSRAPPASCSGSPTRTWRCCLAPAAHVWLLASGAPRRPAAERWDARAASPRASRRWPRWSRSPAALDLGGEAPVDARADGRRRPDRPRRHAAALLRRRGARGGRWACSCAGARIPSGD